MRHMKKPEKRSFGSINSVVWVILALIVVIAGYKFFYPNHVTNTTSSSDRSSSTKVIKVEEGKSSSFKAQSSSKKTEKKIWTDKQDSELAAFISSWQQTMGQTYTGTNANASVSFGGVSFPDYLSKGQIYVNQQEVSMQWTRSEKADSEYKVVAVYTGDQYMYLFTFHNGQPEVLVTSQSASDGMNFKVTENADLVAEFQKVAAENTDK
ncbi:DUF4767 domain-containing protein [Pediococcus pentosaceus]|uniref:DUF4767 domain-containing protein n=1 Tax=Pediococcus pentosaceus TaxID=1255 RepID=UPI0018A17894|nr:DUF4767 domain-containing protein [Pediococcus pentosaceus]MBF7128878.1 DUF4767 domain-containing protein [Pediococcus pentosaceus]MBF7131994.1 DUF4767 domain-containing protein [Pediococcus pentosaceus]